jgi:hypothetical protein
MQLVPYQYIPAGMGKCKARTASACSTEEKDQSRNTPIGLVATGEKQLQDEGGCM